MNKGVLVILVGCVCHFGSAIDKEIVDLLVNKMKSCAAQEHASEADIDDLMHHRVPQSHEGKCMIFCMHVQLSIQTPNGLIDREGSIAMLDMVKDINEDLHGKFIKVINICNDQVAADPDPCITAGNWATCAVREIAALGIDTVFIE